GGFLADRDASDGARVVVKQHGEPELNRLPFAVDKMSRPDVQACVVSLEALIRVRRKLGGSRRRRLLVVRIEPPAPSQLDSFRQAFEVCLHGARRRYWQSQSRALLLRQTRDFRSARRRDAMPKPHDDALYLGCHDDLRSTVVPSKIKQTFLVEFAVAPHELGCPLRRAVDSEAAQGFSSRCALLDE